MFPTQTGLVVAGQQLVQVDEFCVVLNHGQSTHYHSLITFQAQTPTIEAEFVYHGGQFRSDPSAGDIHRVKVGDLTHHMGLSRIHLGFTPPVAQGNQCHIGVEADLTHQVPLDRFLRYSGERGLDKLQLEVFFHPESVPKRVWQIRFAFESGKPIPTDEHEVELQSGESGEPEDDHCHVSLELQGVEANIETGFRWEW